MTETPPQAQDDDPRPVDERAESAEAPHTADSDGAESPDSRQHAAPPSDQVPSAGPAEDMAPQPPPYRGVYGQQPGTAPSSYGQEPQNSAPQGQQQPGYGAQPYGPAYGPPYDPTYGPQGSYDPRWGYGPPGNPQHPQFGQPTGDDTTMALFCYIGVLIGGFLVPLILYLIKKDQSRFMRFHAAQALNFALTQMIVIFAVVIPLFVVAVVSQQEGLLVLLVPIWLYELISQYVWMIWGAIRSNRGEWHTIPKWACFRMVR